MSGRGKGGKVCCVGLAPPWDSFLQLVPFLLGTRKGRSQAPPQDSSWQHPGYVAFNYCIFELVADLDFQVLPSPLSVVLPAEVVSSVFPVSSTKRLVVSLRSSSRTYVPLCTRLFCPFSPLLSGHPRLCNIHRTRQEKDSNSTRCRLCSKTIRAHSLRFRCLSSFRSLGFRVSFCAIYLLYTVFL